MELSDASCHPVEDTKFASSLPATWSRYLTSTKLCPLAISSKHPAAIYLVTIFSTDYYANKSNDAPWEDFPKPWLVDATGRQVGELPELFPEQSPGVMQLKYGKWIGDLPSIIKIHIFHPGVAGDIDYPALKWENNLKQYRVTAL